jgi:hypothetical protein
MRPLRAIAGVVWLMAGCGLGTATAQAPTPPPDGMGWTLAMPTGGRIRYEGMLNLDRAGLQQGPMMYPAPGLIGLLAVVATHGVVATSMRNAEKTRMQEEADGVLRPYLGIIERLDDATLARDGLARMTGTVPGQWQPAGMGAGTEAARWRVEGLPVFRLTQDQAAFVLDHTVRVQRGGDDPSAPPMFDSTVRVVSAPLTGDVPQTQWLADDGRLLRETLAALYARSLEIALQRATGSTVAAAAPMRTVRYDEGRNTRIERARVLHAGCDRWLIENLRGWLISVPVRADGPACAAQISSETAPQTAESAAQPR